MELILHQGRTTVQTGMLGGSAIGDVVHFVRVFFNYFSILEVK